MIHDDIDQSNATLLRILHRLVSDNGVLCSECDYSLQFSASALTSRDLTVIALYLAKDRLS